MPSLKEFRENSSRSVGVYGEINDELVCHLTPAVCKLRGESNDPITVYINSPGGNILNAEQIRELLSAPNQDGAVCRIVTVATSHADSAAAGLLALGDYAIAYPAAAIHFHGFRLSHREITTARAEHLAASLKQRDDEFALRLARRTFQRIAFHFANLKSTFAQIRDTNKDESIKGDLDQDLGCFCHVISGKLSPDFKNLPGRVYKKQRQLAEMGKFIFRDNLEFKDSDPWAKKEAELLKRILEFELAHNDLKSWSLMEGGIEDLALDFKGFADYLFGDHHQSLETQIEAFGVIFLEKDESIKYQDLFQKDAEAANRWLKDEVSDRVRDLWYFVVSLCRLLQSGEYGLDAYDAYWLGIVDEVIGARLPSFRLIAENPSPSDS